MERGVETVILDVIDVLLKHQRRPIDGVTWNIRAVMAFGQRGEWTDFVLERAGKDAAA